MNYNGGWSGPHSDFEFTTSMRFALLSVLRKQLIVAGLGVALLSGCGGDDDDSKKSKPPAKPSLKAADKQKSKSDTDAESDAEADSPDEKSTKGAESEPTPALKPARPADPSTLLRASLEDAVALLRQRKFNEFLQSHVPVEELRRHREDGTVDAVVRALEANSEGQARLLQIYELASQLEFLPNASTGLTELTVILPGLEPPQEQVPNVPDPRNDPVTLPTGFSGDLTECLTQAANALEGGALPTFINKMLPSTDFRDYAAGTDGLELVQFLERNPAMMSAMEAELRALAKETPELSADESVATFQQNGRTVRFQLVDGSWRFFDDSLPVQTAIFQQAQQQPTDVRVILRFERIGDAWRAYQWPSELSELLSPRDESL